MPKSYNIFIDYINIISNFNKKINKKKKKVLKIGQLIVDMIYKRYKRAVKIKLNVLVSNLAIMNRILDKINIMC